MENEKLTKSQIKKQIINNAIEEYINTPLYDRSIKKISSKFGINQKTLSKYLKLNNVEIMQNKNRCSLYEEAFDNIDTEEKAYWLGFLYADGWVSSKGNTVGLTLALKDIEHLKKYNNFLRYEKGLNISENHYFNSKEHINTKGETLYSVSTQISNKHLYNSLNDKGCIPNKSLILKFPNIEIFNSKDLIIHFIRGYFDGDGSLGVYPHSLKNTNLEESLNFVGTKNMLEEIQEYLIKGYLYHKSNCSSYTYKLQYSTNKAKKVAELMYSNASIYLDRKYNIYINKFAPLKSSKIGED